MNSEKVQLNNEYSLIGSILINGDCMVDVIDIVDAQDFTSLSCAEIYSCASEMYLSGSAIDPIALMDMLRVKNINIPEMTSFIHELIEITPTSYNASIYAKSIAESSKMRKINEFIAQSLIEHKKSEILIETIMSGLYDMSVGKTKGKSKLLGHVMHDLASWVNDKSVGDERIKTGYLDIDRVMGGMSKGNLIIIAGRPGTGKSTLGANIALNIAEKGTPTLFFSCEMSNQEIAQRFIANRAKIDLDSIINKSFVENEDDKNKAGKVATALSQLPLSIYDEAGISVNDIRREVQTTKNIGLVVIDYLQIMKVIGEYENRNLEISGITMTLKHLAKEFNIPIILLSQLNRAKDEFDEPQVNHLRDSGSIEQDADKIIMLWRIEEAVENELPKIGVKLAKNRMGKTGAFIMLFRGKYMEFLNSIEPYIPNRSKGGRKKSNASLPF